MRGKPGVHRVMEDLEPLLEQHGLIASRNVRFTRTALNSSLGRERIGFHRPMTMCAMKTYAGFRSEMNPATGEHAWASLAQIELYVDPDQQGIPTARRGASLGYWKPSPPRSTGRWRPMPSPGRS